MNKRDTAGRNQKMCSKKSKANKYGGLGLMDFVLMCKNFANIVRTCKSKINNNWAELDFISYNLNILDQRNLNSLKQLTKLKNYNFGAYVTEHCNWLLTVCALKLICKFFIVSHFKSCLKHSRITALYYLYLYINNVGVS